MKIELTTIRFHQHNPQILKSMLMTAIATLQTTSIGNIAMSGVNGIRSVGCQLPTPIYMYLLWISGHFAAAHMYAWMCVPATVYGFIASPFLAPLPYCRATAYIIYHGNDMMWNMWLIVGTWCIAKSAQMVGR
jgi:hypothetical protein